MAKIPPKLQREWDIRLAESGFRDIEDSQGRLSQPNTRTSAWESRGETLEYFSLLDHYLSENTALSRLERKILEMHSEGKQRGEIAHEVYRSLGYIKLILSRHRKRILHKDDK